VFSTNVAQGEQTRAIDLLPAGFPYRVYPVGQLDSEAKGLLLLTNDGELTNRLTHPRYGVPKTYRAVVDGFVNPADIAELEKGIWLADPKKGGFKTGRSRIQIEKRLRDKTILEITIREGRNRQIRRMLARIGHKVRDLTRVRMGTLELKGLGVGEFRELTPRELKELRSAADRREKADEVRRAEKSAGAESSHSTKPSHRPAGSPPTEHRRNPGPRKPARPFSPQLKRRAQRA
jgi:pseudouridine synthase